MPLNKLENFIKNTEGRILYVNPSDLDSTDAITNQGNSLTQPFKTIQRALLESARFSYLRGNDNDIVEKTTVLVFPGEHVIDNRPGYAIKDDGGVATIVSPSATESVASTSDLSLTLDSNFDLTQENNVLYKFNSIYGGVVIPRGTSIVGLDLRKTKIRPKYVPNPTDSSVAKSAIFRVTGSCYFFQFTFFDGNESETVYTDSADFSDNNKSKPTFSHHKLTCFEYADGINIPAGYQITDLDMYYSKLSNAFNLASTRDIDQKYPGASEGFAKQRPEWEIVGAFATDPVIISKVIAGDGFTPGAVVTVTTSTAHKLNAGTPIKVKGVTTLDFNISTTVASVVSDTQFTYLLPFVRDNLPASPGVSSATVTIETDTVAGASPYVFSCSMRSVWGMNGMVADGKKASGFKSMVVAQFTGVSLQKDDRAFVKYNSTSRLYEGILVTLVKGSALSQGSSSLDPTTVYHSDSNAIYRSGWEGSHIKIINDAVLQIVSVFAIGYNKHFDIQSGSDASITNSNSNFGQISLAAEGFKDKAFAKDDNAYITSIITPKAIASSNLNVDWTAFDVTKTKAVGISSHLYLHGYDDQDDAPPATLRGYRVGAKKDDKVSVDIGGVKQASVLMTGGITSSEKTLKVISGPASNEFTTSTHNLITGESIRLISDDGDLPENIDENTLYYAIVTSSTKFKVASSKTNADNGTAITVYGGTNLSVLSRVHDKESGDIGSPVQWDATNSNWYVHVPTTNDVYTAINGLGGTVLKTDVSYIIRREDPRSLDDKLYKVRAVVPKESVNAKDPTEGFIIQESSTTGARGNTDFTLTSLTSNDYGYERNSRFISTCTVASNVVTVTTELPHDLNINDLVNIKNVTSTNNITGAGNSGYNSTFKIASVADGKTFTYSTTDIVGFTHNPGSDSTNDSSVRDTALPRFERNDIRSNYYIYRNETITPFIRDVQDGIYHLYVIKADNAIATEFTDIKYSQNVENLYPQLDKDNENDNPESAVSFAKRDPLGDVATNDLKKSITREAIDKLVKDFGISDVISSVQSDTTAGISTITFNRNHSYSGISTGTITAGANYAPTTGISTYHNVKLLGNNANPASGTWNGATARVVVQNGAVLAATIVDPGSGYSAAGLFFDQTVVGAGNGNARYTIATAGISTNVGDVIQVTGIGTTAGGHHRITSVPAANKVAIAITAGDPVLIANQYAVHIGPSVVISSDTYDATTGLSTFTCSGSHGLVSGNQFRILDSSNNNLGDYHVKEKVGVNTFSATTNANLSGAFLLRHGLSSGNANSGKGNESLAARGLSFYDGDTLSLVADITSAPTATTLRVAATNSGIGTDSRFPLGSYVQVDNEIMRVTSTGLTGSGNDEISVIRGSLGTVKENHTNGSIIRKIKPVAVEFRRPSIIRASGHTFEYLGYGPGNYSTGLPQVQVRTLSERAEFLAQSQERGCGTVVYTGMNNDGDFFIGNKRVSSATGQERTFDAPVPTVTGQDPSRLSVIFDEVVVKDRLIVEGGTSSRILSQFDGPVTFNGEARFNTDVTINGALKLNSALQVIDTTQSVSKDTGCYIIEGGMGVEKNIYIGGLLNVAGISTFTGLVDANGGVTSDNLRFGVTTDNTIDTSTGDITVNSAGGTVIVDDQISISGVTTITNTTNSTSRTTGALVVAGGVGIATDLFVGGDITAFASSDERLKDNVSPIDDPLSKVLSISGNTFNWNQASKWEGKADTGVIAQEIEALGLPGLAEVRDDGTHAVRYEKLTALLIEAVKELSSKVDNLEQKLSDK